MARTPCVPTLKDLMSADVSEVIQAMERVAQVLLRGCNISIGLFFANEPSERRRSDGEAAAE